MGFMAEASPSQTKLAFYCEEWLLAAEKAVRTIYLRNDRDGYGYHKPGARFTQYSRILAQAAGNLDGGIVEGLAAELCNPEPDHPGYQAKLEKLLAGCRAILKGIERPADGNGALNLAVPYSAAQLAEEFGLPAEALRKRLEAFRKDNLEGYVEVPNAKSRQPRFLFYLSAVQPIINSMKISGEPPAKKKTP
jgi:hypothetical protein